MATTAETRRFWRCRTEKTGGDGGNAFDGGKRRATTDSRDLIPPEFNAGFFGQSSCARTTPVTSANATGDAPASPDID